MKNVFLPCLCAVALAAFTACIQRPSPEQVTAAYFEAVAEGDMFALRPFLTPDGQEILDQMAAVPELRAAMQSQREGQKQFWTGIQRSVSQPSIEGNRAVVNFTAEVPGRGKAVCPVVLFLIDGEWKISSTSISGLGADRFRNELVALKMTAASAAGSAPAATPDSGSTAAAPAAAEAVEKAAEKK